VNETVSAKTNFVVFKKRYSQLNDTPNCCIMLVMVTRWNCLRICGQLEN